MNIKNVVIVMENIVIKGENLIMDFKSRTPKSAEKLKSFLSGNKISKRNIYDLVIREYIYCLIYGDMDGFERLSPIAGILGINISPNFVMTIIYDDFWNISEERDNSWRYSFKRNLLDATIKATEEHESLTATLIGTDKIVLLLSCNGKNKDESYSYIRETADGLMEKLKVLTGYSVSIGVSSYFEGNSKVSSAYQESFMSLEDVFFEGMGSVVFSDEKKLPSTKTKEYRRDLIHDFIVEIGLLNKSAAESISDQFIDSLIQSNSKKDFIKSKNISFISEAAQFFEIIFKNGDFKNSDFIIEEYTKNIMNAGTIVSIRKYNKWFIEILTSRLSSISKDEFGIGKVISYTEKYYMNDITLEKMAKLSGYSTSYFSRLFKKIQEINFTSYLHIVRIQNAEKLMENTDEKLYVISQNVGYNDFSYFSRMFKEITGTTPSEYKAFGKASVIHRAHHAMNVSVP